MNDYIEIQGEKFPVAKSVVELIEDQKRQIAHLKKYSDTLARGFPEGMLPKDVENIREANWKLSAQVQELQERLAALDTNKKMVGYYVNLVFPPRMTPNVWALMDEIVQAISIEGGFVETMNLGLIPDS